MSKLDQKRITVLISGYGSNLQAIIDAIGNNKIENTVIVRVISNTAKAYGLERATRASIPTEICSLLPYKKRYPSTAEGIKEARREYDINLANLIIKDGPDLVVCAGWMHILSSFFLELLTLNHICIVNLHPALPGAFDGANAIQRAYEEFKKGNIRETGVMVHWVTENVDQGEPLVVKRIRIVNGESLQELESRIHTIEREAIVEGTIKALNKK